MQIKKRINIVCIVCGVIKAIRADAVTQPYRCQSCAAKQRIKDYPETGMIGMLTWKGGETVHPKGYALVKIYPSDPYYPMAQKVGYILKHRLVMARHLGRCLRSDEDVHHIDGNVLNNATKNLQLLNHNGHSSMPKRKRQNFW